MRLLVILQSNLYADKNGQCRCSCARDHLAPAQAIPSSSLQSLEHNHLFLWCGHLLWQLEYWSIHRFHYWNGLELLAVQIQEKVLEHVGLHRKLIYVRLGGHADDFTQLIYTNRVVPPVSTLPKIFRIHIN